jgi:RNA recognition motif-containing protein
MSNIIFIGNISAKTSREELKKLFSEVGTVRDVGFLDIKEQRKPGLPRLFDRLKLSYEMPWLTTGGSVARICVVEMASEEEARAAIDAFSGVELPGSPGRPLLLFGPHGPGDNP